MDKHCDQLTMRATLISHGSAYRMLVNARADVPESYLDSVDIRLGCS